MTKTKEFTGLPQPSNDRTNRPQGIMSLRVSEPCTADLESMEPRTHGWFCEQCKKKVHDFSKLTTFEARLLLISKNGHLCGRLQYDEHGLPVFAESKLLKAVTHCVAKPGVQAALAVTVGTTLLPTAKVEAPEYEDGRMSGVSADLDTQFDARTSPSSCAPHSLWPNVIPDAEAQGGGPTGTFGGVEYSSSGGILYDSYFEAGSSSAMGFALLAALLSFTAGLLLATLKGGTYALRFAVRLLKRVNNRTKQS